MENKASKEVSQKNVLEFQLHLQNPSMAILLFGPYGSDREGLARKISRDLKAQFERVSLETLFKIGTNQKNGFSIEFALLNLFESHANDHCVLFFEDCERIFYHSSMLPGIILSYLKSQEENKKYANTSENNSNQKGRFCIFSTSRPLQFPEMLLDRVGIPVYVGLPTLEERKEFIRKEILQFSSQQCSKEEIEPLVEYISDLSKGHSFEKISTFLNLVFAKKMWESKQSQEKNFVLPTVEDFKTMRFIFTHVSQSSLIEMEEMKKFASRYGIVIDDMRNVDSRAINEYRWYPSDRIVAQYLGKRRCEDGSWEVRVKWKRQWVPAKEFPFLKQEDLDKLDDFTHKRRNEEYEAAKELHNMFDARPNGIDSKQKVSLEIKKELNDVKDSCEMGTPKSRSKKRKFAEMNNTQSAVQQSKKKTHEGLYEESNDGDEKERYLEDDEYKLQTILPAKKRSPKPSPKIKSKKGKLKNPDSVLSSPKSKRVKWYQTYKGALAYAILKAKSWSVRGNGYLDVHLESDKKKFGGSVYDWDILWLGMKLIPGICLSQTNGVNAARKLVKNHYIIKPKLTEWRKTRTYLDDELRKIFSVNFVNTDSEMIEFMNRHKSWNDEDEERLMYECKVRAGILDANNPKLYLDEKQNL